MARWLNVEEFGPWWLAFFGVLAYLVALQLIGGG